VRAGDNSMSFCAASCAGPAPVRVTVSGYQAVRGYDLASGLGTVDAAELVRALTGR
jgi:hypothetical protein